MMGTVRYSPGPTTRFRLPKRSTTTFSHDSAMCTDDTASSATISMSATVSTPMRPVSATPAASTTAHDSANTARLKMSAPLRDDLRGT